MFSGSKQKSLFDYLHYYISLLIFLNFQKLESDLDVARVEVGHAMGVHTRAKAALMAGLGKKNIENSRSKMGFMNLGPFIFENDLSLEKNRTGFCCHKIHPT